MPKRHFCSCIRASIFSVRFVVCADDGRSQDFPTIAFLSPSALRI
jgi:hypothetical protein